MRVIMDKDLNKTVGRNLRKYRRALGLTQETLAEKANISPSFYANIERGNKSMSIEVLCKLSAVLGVSSDSLLYEDKNTAPLNSIVMMLRDRSPEELEFFAGITRSFLEELEKIHFRDIIKRR